MRLKPRNKACSVNRVATQIHSEIHWSSWRVTSTPFIFIYSTWFNEKISIRCPGAIEMSSLQIIVRYAPMSQFPHRIARSIGVFKFSPLSRRARRGGCRRARYHRIGASIPGPVKIIPSPKAAAIYRERPALTSKRKKIARETRVRAASITLLVMSVCRPIS